MKPAIYLATKRTTPKPVHVAFDLSVTLRQGEAPKPRELATEPTTLRALIAAVASHVLAWDQRLDAHLKPRASRDACPLCGGRMASLRPTKRLAWRECIDCKRHQEAEPVRAA